MLSIKNTRLYVDKIRIMGKKNNTFIYLIIFVCIVMLLNGAVVRKNPPKTKTNVVPAGGPNYEQMFSDGKLRIAIFWGYDHPRDTIIKSLPAFTALNGKRLFYRGYPISIEIGMITQIDKDPRGIFKTALEDPSVDVVIYSGHARYGTGMAFSAIDDIFRCGNGDMIEDRHTKPYKIVKAGSEDLDATVFPRSYKLIFLNCCDSGGHFRDSWQKRFVECNAPVDLLTVEEPVFNFYDYKRVLDLLQDLVVFADWGKIKTRYDSEIYKRKNKLIIDTVQERYSQQVMRKAQLTAP
jgi:hypothetical protein